MFKIRCSFALFSGLVLALFLALVLALFSGLVLALFAYAIYTRSCLFVVFDYLCRSSTV